MSRWHILRSGLPSNAFSLTGVIHTLSSLDVLNEIERIAYYPFHHWDALVCTSTAGRDVVQSVINHVRNHIIRKFGSSSSPI